MATKKSQELKKGDKISMAGEKLIVDSIEVSDLGKQGTKKARIVALKSNKEKVVIIRPADYPMQV
jgi:translation elongation factor P/translation initiation factor 5A